MRERQKTLRKAIITMELQSIVSNLMTSSWQKMNDRAPYKGSNPIAEIPLIKVLCNECFSKNDEDYKFCKTCAAPHGKPSQGLTDKEMHKSIRLLGTVQTFQFPEQQITKEKEDFFKYKASK